MIISSRSNPKIKHLRLLQQRKIRRQTGNFVLEGLDLLQEAFTFGYQIHSLFRSEGVLCPQLQAVADEDYELKSELMAYVSMLKSPPEVVAVVRQQEIAEDSQRYPAWLLAEGLQDPGNFGALFRLANAMNWRGILTVGDSPDPFQSKVIRGSMGSSLHLPVKHLSLQELSAWASEGWTVLATAADASQSSFQMKIPQKLILALGHEGQGLSSKLQAVCTHRIAIPIQKSVDSLNVATAAAMLVHECNRQWSAYD